MSNGAALLTSEEVARIRAEFHLRKELQDAVKAPKGWSDRLAHPFVITILGGLLLAAAGAYLQRRVAEAAINQSRALQIEDKRLAIASTFVTNFHHDFTLLINRTNARAFLYRSRSEPKMKDQVGRGRQEVMKMYELLLEQYFKTGPRTTRSSEVQAWFCSDPVLQNADTLNKIVEELEAMSFKPQGIDAAVLKEFSDRAGIAMREIHIAMANEIRTGESGNCRVKFLNSRQVYF